MRQDDTTERTDTRHPCQLVDRFLNDGAARAAILADIVKWWLTSPDDSALEMIVKELLSSSQMSTMRMALIDELVGGTLVKQLITASPASQAAYVSARVASRFLALKPDSAAVVGGLADALKSASKSEAEVLYQAIGNLLHQNPMLVGEHVIPVLIRQRTSDLFDVRQLEQRWESTARCLHDIKTLTPMLS
ncbi:MAG: hypothetical protein SGPRY_010874, partial [Prymnesium sp.]